MRVPHALSAWCTGSDTARQFSLLECVPQSTNLGRFQANAVHLARLFLFVRTSQASPPFRTACSKQVVARRGHILVRGAVDCRRVQVCGGAEAHARCPILRRSSARLPAVRDENPALGCRLCRCPPSWSPRLRVSISPLSRGRTSVRKDVGRARGRSRRPLLSRQAVPFLISGASLTDSLTPARRVSLTLRNVKIERGVARHTYRTMLYGRDPGSLLIMSTLSVSQ
jgi:hypothetical protein